MPRHAHRKRLKLALIISRVFVDAPAGCSRPAEPRKSSSER